VAEAVAHGEVHGDRRRLEGDAQITVVATDSVGDCACTAERRVRNCSDGEIDDALLLDQRFEVGPDGEEEPRLAVDESWRLLRILPQHVLTGLVHIREQQRDQHERSGQAPRRSAHFAQCFDAASSRTSTLPVSRS
jgi:hypothetical protein